MDKKLKLILFILFVLIIGFSVTIGILYFTTDLLKPNEYIFQKFFLQNFANISNVIDFNEEEKLLTYISKNDYTSKTDAHLTYKEKENDQEEIYSITGQEIVNNTKNSAYRRIKADYGSEELIVLDLMNIENTYGAKFKNIDQKFLCIQNPFGFIFKLNSMLNEEMNQKELSLKDLKITELLDFSPKELEEMQKRYFNAIFIDFNKESYSKKKNVMITLNNGKSVTTTRYTLNLSQTEADKIVKRILNQIAEDEIILSRLEKIENEIGINIKELFIDYIKNKADSIEYSAQNDKTLSLNVFITDEVMVRTSCKTPNTEYKLDYDYSNGTTLSLEESKLTNEGEDKKVYTIGSFSNGTRNIEYKDNNQHIKLGYKIEGDEQQTIINSNLEYNGENLNLLKLDLKANMDFLNKRDFKNTFNEENSILLNDKESDEIDEILSNIKEEEIKAIESKQTKINTKLLNNILLWVDNKRNIKDTEEKEKQNEEINRFNNMFKLFEGENIDYKTISKLLETASENLKDFEVVDGKHINILIEPNSKNEEKFEKIKNAISNKYKYNVDFKYDSSGYINIINISIYEKK